MKHVVLMEASNTANQKKYKCPYCDQRFIRSKLHIHIQDKHEELIPEGYTALRVAFNTINHKDHGTCIICKQESPWNEIKGRYERLCGKESCKEAYKKMVAERNKKIYDTERLQTDPRYAAEVQQKALAGRRISGKYKFDDGGEIAYVGKYERNLLEFLDKTMKCNSEDILSPGPAVEYEWEGKTHTYLPDFYYIPYNLIIEVKDGGDNPNNNPGVKRDNQDRLKAKENAIKNKTKYNYIRLTNNDFGQLLSIMAVLKYTFNDHPEDHIIRINESSILESKIKNPKLYFISKYSRDDDRLLPRVPDNYLTKNGYEDNTTPRVCFSETINGCLTGLSRNIDNQEFYVHMPTGYYEVIKPTKEQVPDVDITKEKWICSPVDVKCIGKIKAFDDGKPGIKFKYGDNKSAEIFTWDYEWIEKYDSVNEGYIFSKDNLYINFDKFKDGKTNICFVTGLSGSGKSTEASKIAKENNAEWIELDIFEYCRNFTDEQLKEAGQVFYDYLSSHKDIWDKLKNNKIHGNDLNAEISRFIKYCINWCLKHKENKWVIEGVQIFSFIDPKEIKNYPIVFIRASMVKSILQRWKRNGDGKIKLWEELKNEFPQLLAWYIDNEKAFKDFQKAVLNESRDFKNNGNSNIVITNNIEIAWKLYDRYKNAALIKADEFQDCWIHRLEDLNIENNNETKSFYDYINSVPELKKAFTNGTVSKSLLYSHLPSYFNYLLYWCMKYKDARFIIYSKYIESMVDEYTLRKIKIFNESNEAGMTGTIGAALPLTPAPTPYESDKDNYYIINNLGNNAFAGDYSIAKDPIEYNTYSFDVENGYKVFKSKKIDKKSLVFKLKDKQSAKELYEEIENLYNQGLSIPYPEYIFERYTGKFLFDPTELLNEDSIELVYGEDLQEIYESVNNFLHPKSIDILEEQVNQLIYSINEYDIEDEYNVLPEDVPNLEELDAWKDRYNFMSRDKKKTSNAISVQRYGRDNITRYGILRHKFLSEDPGVDDHLNDIGDSIGIDPIVDDIF